MTTAAWDELLAAALLGTERRTPARPQQAEGALAQALDGLPWEDPEAALLGAAGLLAGYRTAGWQPPALAEAPAPAPRDERPLCSPGAAAILARLLDSGPALLLPEWLRLAGAAGLRPPPELLPALLDAGARAASLRTAILAVGGARLRWLAGLDERWEWAGEAAAAGAGIEERWRTGTRDERLALLREVRRADPARGRELLSATWSSDGAADRALLVQALAVGLDPSDEPFLEDALDDRSKLVRQEAAQLLAQLPSSAFAARMAQRLRPLVSVGGRLRRRLEVQTPPEPDDAARRDGVDDAHRPQGLGIGARAWHLAQIVAGTPLAFWEEVTGADAGATFALARDCDHVPALTYGWSIAARRQRDPQWSTVLARETQDPGLLDPSAPGAGDAAAAVFATAAGAITLSEMLERIPGPWTASLSRLAIDHLARALATAGTADLYGIRLGHLALALDLHARDAAITALEPLLQRDLQPTVRRQLAELLANLDLRHAITRELTPP